MQQATGQEETAPLLPGISKHKHTDVLLGVRTDTVYSNHMCCYENGSS